MFKIVSIEFLESINYVPVTTCHHLGNTFLHLSFPCALLLLDKQTVFMHEGF